MKQFVAFALAVGMVTGLAFTVTAQQTGPTVPPPSTPAQTPSSGGSSASGAGSGSGTGDLGKMSATIDCARPSASGSTSTAGSGSIPSASGSTSGSTAPSAGTASPSASVSAGAGQAQRVEGEIKNLDASGKTFEIGNVKLEWDASSAILVDCQTASATDLKDGAKVKAAYQVRDGKNVLTILEAEKN